MNLTKYHSQNLKMQPKVCVLITVQESAKLLIDKGLSETASCGGELHILHVQQGGNLLKHKNTVNLLRDLLEYGGNRGAVIHLLCAEDVAECVGDFITRHQVGLVVMGEPAGWVNRNGETEFSRILMALPPQTEVISLPAAEISPKEKMIV